VPTLLFPTPPGQALTLCSSIKRLMGFKPVGKYGPTGDMTMAIVLLQHTSSRSGLLPSAWGMCLVQQGMVLLAKQNPIPNR